ncbi:MAG: response regulator [Thermodesulfobacteriota bacterium]|nr:response regulator [Thermodesulfobacteriota bacterium]
MQQEKILIIDDESTVADLMIQALQMVGYNNVEKANNGQDGFEKYKMFLPDLVIMDIEMPVMDGYESSSKIKSFDPDARIMVLTGNPSDSRARRTLEEDMAFTLLQKPISIPDLSRIVRESLPSHA